MQVKTSWGSGQGLQTLVLKVQVKCCRPKAFLDEGSVPLYVPLE